MAIPAVVEGYMESVFLPVMLEQIGRADLNPIIRIAGGGSRFWLEAARYNEAGKYITVMGLADLEQVQCASSLLTSKLRHKSVGFHLRIAVRMLESWLLADRHAMARFLKVPISALPISPDGEVHAKRALVDIARRSTSKNIRDALVPDDSGGVVGPDYAATMSKFIQHHWRVSVARKTSPSLEKACQRWFLI